MNITIPTDLSEISLLKWEQVMQDIKLIDNEILLKIKLVSLICDVDLDTVANMKMNDINEVYDVVFTMMNKEPELVKTFEIDGVKFGFNPDLDNLKSNEFLDLSVYYGVDIFRTMAVLYRPITKEYKGVYAIEKYKGSDTYFELMKRAPASAYLGAAVFFWKLGIELLKLTPQFLAENLTKQEEEVLLRNGVGISQLTQLLEGIDLSLKR